jgi:hypothetical protein
VTFLSLLRVDWKMARKTLAREWLNRFAMFFILAGFLLTLLASGGVNRFLSEQWVVNAVFRPNVSAAEGAGIASKAEKLPGVRAVTYKDPEAAWKEFLVDYPGLESLRTDGSYPVPGYLTIRLRPERLTVGDIASVENALRPLPQVEKVYTGAQSLPRLLKVREWINLSLWGFFALLAVVFFAVCALQESVRACALRPDFAFLEDRGISSRSIMLARGGGSAIIAALLVLPAIGASAALLVYAGNRFPSLASVVGPVDALANHGAFPMVLVFAVSVPVLIFAASLYGWRASSPRKPNR